MNGLLIVVAQDESGIYGNLRRRFEGKGRVRVVRDRRLSERRMATVPYHEERRVSDRRSRSDLTRRLRSLGYAMISVLDPGAAPPSAPRA
jgi:hypothetical protein